MCGGVHLFYDFVKSVFLATMGCMTLESGNGNLNTQRDEIEKLQLPDLVVVTSASAIKVDTVRKVLEEIFPKRKFNVIGVKATSGVNEQPVGEETEQGARNRIESAESLVESEHPGHERAMISIENGIFPDEKGGWEDKAVAVIKLPDRGVFSAVSPQGVPFPIEAVRAAQAKEGGFKDHTVGSVIAEMYAEKGIEINKQDPHSALTGGSFSREEQMTSAIKEALLKVAAE